MKRILTLHEQAKKDKRKIVLPEGEDERVIKAASVLAEGGLADVILLGVKDDVAKLAKEHSLSLDGVELIDPNTHEEKEDIIGAYYEKRKHKGITLEEAEKSVLENFVNYGAMMTRLGMAEGFVAGASHTTATIARAAIHCLNIDREIGTVSSAFIMEMENCPFGEDGLFIYGDCGIIPYPSARQLTGIAIATSDQMKKLLM